MEWIATTMTGYLGKMLSIIICSEEYKIVFNVLDDILIGTKDSRRFIYSHSMRKHTGS